MGWVGHELGLADTITLWDNRSGWSRKIINGLGLARSGTVEVWAQPSPRTVEPVTVADRARPDRAFVQVYTYVFKKLSLGGKVCDGFHKSKNEAFDR